MLLPENASTYGAQIDRLFWWILGITGFFFFLVQGCLLAFILLYRAQPGKRAAYLHGNTALEVIWTLIPALILGGVALASQKIWVEIRSLKGNPNDFFQVEVLAEQFAWNIRYPGADAQFETADDVTTINQLHLPLGSRSLVKIRSKDVIHSFFVPEFRLKQDAVPGLPTQIWVEPTRAGEFEIRCAELCGLGHYRMRGFVTVESPRQLQAWLKETKANE